jgi:hypothetical protein
LSEAKSWPSGPFVIMFRLIDAALPPCGGRPFHEYVEEQAFPSNDASSLRSANVISPISILSSSISVNCRPSYNGSAQWSPVRTWSTVIGFVRRIHLYHSKNRLSTSTSNRSSSAKNGLGGSWSMSSPSSPVSREGDGQQLTVRTAHRYSKANERSRRASRLADSGRLV